MPGILPSFILLGLKSLFTPEMFSSYGFISGGTALLIWVLIFDVC